MIIIFVTFVKGYLLERCGNTIAKSNHWLHKKQTTRRDRMNSVTINNIWLKCYLKLFKLVAVEMRGSKVSAIALNGVNFFLEKNIIVFQVLFLVCYLRH